MNWKNSKAEGKSLIDGSFVVVVVTLCTPPPPRTASLPGATPCTLVSGVGSALPHRVNSGQTNSVSYFLCTHGFIISTMEIIFLEGKPNALEMEPTFLHFDGDSLHHWGGCYTGSFRTRPGSQDRRAEGNETEAVAKEDSRERVPHRKKQVGTKQENLYEKQRGERKRRYNRCITDLQS